MVKAHGWMSYELSVREGVTNTLVILGKGQEGHLSFTLSVDGEVTRHQKAGDGILECEYLFTPAAGKDKVTVKIERNSEYMPYIYTLKIKFDSIST